MKIDIDEIKRIARSFCDSDEEFSQFSQFIDKSIDKIEPIEYMVAEALFGHYSYFMSILQDHHDIHEWKNKHN